MNLKLKYVYGVIKSHCTITRLAKCILKNQKYLLFFYKTWNTVSWIAFLQLPTHNLIFCLAHLLIFKQNMQNWLQTIGKKIITYTQNLTKPKIGGTWSITNYGCPKIVLNNMIFWNLIWSPEIRRQIRPFLVLFKIRTCYLKKNLIRKMCCQIQMHSALKSKKVPFEIFSKGTIKLANGSASKNFRDFYWSS